MASLQYRAVATMPIVTNNSERRELAIRTEVCCATDLQSAGWAGELVSTFFLNLKNKQTKPAASGSQKALQKQTKQRDKEKQRY